MQCCNTIYILFSHVLHTHMYVHLTLGKDKAQITWISQADNHPKQYSKTFDQSSQYTTKGCVYIYVHMYDCIVCM